MSRDNIIEAGDVRKKPTRVKKKAVTKKPVKKKKKALKEEPIKKRKVKKIDPDTPKKKKKAPTRDMASVEKRVKKKKSDVEVMEKQFDELVDGIQDSAQLEEYVHMFKKLQKISRTCEKKYLKDKQSRDIYPLMQIYNQMREIIADLKALKDVSIQVGQFNEEVLNPFATLSAQAVMDFFQGTKVSMQKYVDPQNMELFLADMQKLAKAAGVSINLGYQNSIESSSVILSGN